MKTIDHLLIVMNRALYDARTLNLIRTLKSRGETIHLFAIGGKSDYTGLPDFKDDEVTFILKEDSSRMYQTWIKFTLLTIARSFQWQSRHIWAMDLFALPGAFFIKLYRNIKLLFDSREVYTAIGHNADHPIKQLILNSIEKFLIAKCDHVFTSGSLDSSYIADYYNLSYPPVVMNLPHKVEVKKTNVLRDEYSINEKAVIIIYQGLIYKGRGVDLMIQALPLLPNVVFIAIGYGSGVNDYLNLAKKLQVDDRFYIKPPIPYRDLLTYTASADIGLCVIEPLTQSLEFALPNKLFEYAISGLPILINDLPQMSPLIKKFKAGIVIPKLANKENIAHGVNLILKGNNEFKKGAINLSEEYHWEKQTEIIASLYES